MTAAAFHTAGRPFSVVQILRPLLTLATLAFLAGFGGYLILGPPNVMNLGVQQQPVAAPSATTPASAPAAAGDWNAPKQV